MPDNDRSPLTERQKQILDYVRGFAADHGYPPTHREICERFGYSSYGTVHKHLRLLREKGYLDRDDHQKRGLKLLGGGGLPEVPFFGRIAAGRPIEAVRGEDTLVVPPHLLRGGEGEHYVLEVNGESMIDEGIHDGDLVIVRRRDVARAGEMVVALVGEEATLKRIYPEGAVVRLQPANAHMAPILVPADEVKVQGIVVGLMRRF